VPQKKKGVKIKLGGGDEQTENFRKTRGTESITFRTWLKEELTSPEDSKKKKVNPGGWQKNEGEKMNFKPFTRRRKVVPHSQNEFTMINPGEPKKKKKTGG